ncbi:hypothetical protein Ancab_021538 [Ancistrocladus abbreviatus]
MSTSVCQGLQSCLEPWLVEPRVLRLKLAQPPSNSTQPSRAHPLFNSDPEQSSLIDEARNKSNKKNTSDDFNNEESRINDLGGWSFLQALASTSPIFKDVNYHENEKTEYVHPMVKRSASVLSDRSLEMCTESLGSETGSIISENSDEFSCLCSDYERFQPPKMRDLGGGRRLSLRGSFPPPLTTMSGVEVKGHREDGRLVMKAVTVKSLQSCFKAERRDGRLRLHFVKNFAEDNEDLENGEDNGFGYDGENDEEEEEEEEDEKGCDGEDMEGINGNDGGEVGVGAGNLNSRPSRCKESESTNTHILAREHLWVASS